MKLCNDEMKVAASLKKPFNIAVNKTKTNVPPPLKFSVKKATS